MEVSSSIAPVGAPSVPQVTSRTQKLKLNKHLTWETGQYRCYNHQIYPTMLSFSDDFTFLYSHDKTRTTQRVPRILKIYYRTNSSGFDCSDLYFWHLTDWRSSDVLYYHIFVNCQVAQIIQLDFRLSLCDVDHHCSSIFSIMYSDERVKI